MRTRKKALFFYTATVTYMAFIFYLSSMESVEGTGTDVFSFDKINHILEFVLLGALLFFSFLFTPLKKDGVHIFPEPGFLNLKKISGKKKLDGFYSFVMGGFFGIFDEIHQSFVPGRNASSGDVAADFIGVSIGILAGFLSIKYYLQSEKLQRLNKILFGGRANGKEK